MTSWLAAWPNWAWATVALLAVASLFGLIFWLSQRIPPEQRDTDNDEWLRRGGS